MRRQKSGNVFDKVMKHSKRRMFAVYASIQTGVTEWCYTFDSFYKLERELCINSLLQALYICV